MGQYTSRVATADLLGYASISCWLCAQLPQVIKNARLKSSDGLSLPFLCSWLFGDMTNLIGCILTDQLPFQTYLATYFCIVDFTLLGQFYYYQHILRPSLPSHETPITYSPRQSLILPPSIPPSSRHRSTSNAAITHSPNRKRPRPLRSHQSYISGSFGPEITTSTTMTDSYQAIYEAALDVARVAERAEARRSHSRHGHGDRMMESFYSEMSAQSTSTSASGDRRIMSLSTSALLDNRGRTLRRDRVEVPTPPPEEIEGIDGLPNEGGQGVQMRRRSASRSLSLVRGQSSRGKGKRAAGIAFMSFGLILGWSKFSTNPLSSSYSGVVLSHRQQLKSTVNIPSIRYSKFANPRLPLHNTETSILSDDTNVPQSQPFDTETKLIPDDTVIQPQPNTDVPPSTERVIGRISAWTCTTLYLASRLPQIWMNFTRKSIEGLSILLFLFAFLGNTTYVLSILLNPLSSSSSYLLEALPYLLGSGGTLMFDLTIMCQAVLYGSSRPVSTTGKRSKMRRKLRYLEDGPGPGPLERSSVVSAGTERQPLLSTGKDKQVFTYSGTERQSLYSNSGKLKERSLSPDVRRSVRLAEGTTTTMDMGRGNTSISSGQG
ncbi:hypothetical protein TREMEDRAFT_73844 [Tremella mesenterica DSM 1558]|uniref:uncharacterized protein n=1 Tax=Tremella mesenterica (strain ATCC 24925 / CBS 8224 / DSM 1558 / NBRC 9311 / NRRL Y-6157 / RJB 2259-6 / UBC 559-6) TaxID=578456 RepID=UPI0003F4A43E|nr:uncharacterized protein TREMEDRAFT_73844 [Tremella mesenterica DSM 1558]EIW69410.1 hypothetical protein TREMEDRAFT_73844 [Tremella mesenterica DSM 1558]